MKSKLSLVLLAVLFLVPAARANSIDYSTGTFSSGALLGSFQGAINVNIVGSLNTIDIITGTLVKTTTGCPPNSTCFDFSNGSVKVSNGSGTVFFDSLSGGITIEENGSASLDATLTTSRSVVVGSATATFDFSGTKITAGSADVSLQRASVTPEPAAMLLFGTGLLGLAITQLRKWQKN